MPWGMRNVADDAYHAYHGNSFGGTFVNTDYVRGVGSSLHGVLVHNNGIASVPGSNSRAFLEIEDLDASPYPSRGFAFADIYYVGGSWPTAGYASILGSSTLGNREMGIFLTSSRIEFYVAGSTTSMLHSKPATTGGFGPDGRTHVLAGQACSTGSTTGIRQSFVDGAVLNNLGGNVSVTSASNIARFFGARPASALTGDAYTTTATDAGVMGSFIWDSSLLSTAGTSTVTDDQALRSFSESLDGLSDLFAFQPVVYFIGDGAAVQTIEPNAIASAESVPSPALNPGQVAIDISQEMGNIQTGEAVFDPSLQQVQIVELNTIATLESVLQPTLQPGPISLALETIASAELVPNPTLQPGQVAINVDAIPSGEVVFNPTIVAGLFINPDAIGSAESVPTPTILPGAVSILASTIGTAESVPDPALITGATIAADAIVSAENVFSPALQAAGLILPDTIASAEAVGVISVLPGAVSIQADPIGTGEAVYQPELRQVLVIQLDEIASAGIVNDVLVIPGTATIIPEAIASAENVYPIVLVGGVDAIGAILATVDVYAAIEGQITVGPHLLAEVRINGIQ